MSATEPGVPRLPLRILETLLPPDVGEPVIGDLIEAFGVRRQRLGLGPARRWFWRETLAAVWSLRRVRNAPPTYSPRGDGALQSFAGDLRHGARLLRRAPIFTLCSALTIGIGIGATTAIFSVVNPVLLRPLPYPDAGRLAMIWERDDKGALGNLGYATFVDLVSGSRSIERAAAVGDWQPILSDPGPGGAAPERVAGERVSWTYFGTLGVHPFLGRDFTASEDAPGKNQVVMLSYGLWRRRFGGDPEIVGRTISIDGNPTAVAGVMPESFDNVIAPDAEIWRVLGYATSLPWACRSCHHLRMVARVRPGVLLSAAASDVDGAFGRIRALYPNQYGSTGGAVIPLQEEVTRAFRPVLAALLSAVALVLLIAVANVTSLQLARAVRREGEFAIRVALGAGRARLVRQLLAEGLLLSTLGAVTGVVIAMIALPALVTRLPDRLPRLSAIHLDGTALALASAIALVIALVISVVPGWLSGGRALIAGLKSGARIAGRSHRLGRAGLVATEVAFALMLLASAGLVARSLVRLMSVDSGFDPAHLLTFEVDASGARYGQNAEVYAYQDRLRAALRALPGVVSVGIANQLPLSGNQDMYGVRAQDKPLANPELAPNGDRYIVSPDYMRTMKIRVVSGRELVDADARDSVPPVAIVSAALAARLWPGENPLGKRIQMGDTTTAWHTVVGVAANVRTSGLDANTTQQFYIPTRQWPWSDNLVSVVVRTLGDPASTASLVRRTVGGLDPSVPVSHVATMEGVVGRSTAQRRLALVLFGCFAAVALLLAAAGIYGVLAGSVAERTKEIGLRSALGATPGDIVRLVVGEGMTMAVAGGVVGLVGAAGSSRLIGSLLYGVAPTDSLTLGGVVAILGAVTLAACVIPARRAVRVDPIASLREE